MTKGSNVEFSDSDLTLPSETPPEAIDAVYLWVDGTDETFQQNLNRFLPRTRTSTTVRGAGRNRFRDNGELRFSLRSLERYAPWIRRVHLITNGQVPSWLDRTHPKVTVVPHDKLFLNAEHLPNFNSNAIELQLHRIPYLTRRFLYLNDDVFFGAPTTPQTFLLHDRTQRLFLQGTPLHNQIDVGPVHDRSYAYTQKVIFKAWRRYRPRLLPAHVPQLYDKEIICEIEKTIPREFEKTASHRFRSAEDLVLRVLYFSHMSENLTEGRASEVILTLESKDYCFSMLGKSTSDNLKQLTRIIRLRPRFFCINDDVEEGLASRVLLRALPWLLRVMFPGRSSFER